MSAGVVLCGEAASPDDALRRAHVAVRRAKQRGRSGLAFVDGEPPQRALRELELERDLAGAIERDEMEVHYQPIVSLDAGVLVGFEALLRWRHPTLGMVPPDHFVPIAERSGHIVPIGRWVLQSAVGTTARWQAEFPRVAPTIAVNVSARQLGDGALVTEIAELLATEPLPHGALTLEVTETSIIERPEKVLPTLEALVDLGVRVALDDFGTGWSSLAYLVELPVTQLKIDRTFVRTLPESTRSRAVCRAILQLGETLNLPVTAEGIETPAQLEWLRAMRCARGQGYLFSRAVNLSGANALLSRDPRWW